MSTINNTGRPRYFSAGLALLGLTGILAGGLVAAAPAQADPPRHAPAFGRRDNDDRRDDHRRADRRDDRRDDRKDHRNDRRDDRRDDHNDRSKWDNRNDHRNSDIRFRPSDRDRDGTPDRYDRYPTNPRRR